jgi:hypothetical protein
MGEKKNVSRVMMGKPEGKRPFERPRQRWENKIKNDR